MGRKPHLTFFIHPKYCALIPHIMSGERDESAQSSMSIDNVIELRQDPVLTPAEKEKLEFALEKHKEALRLLSQ
jgi:hypothetical protein